MKMLFSNRADIIINTEFSARESAKELGFNFDEMIKVKEIDELNAELSIAFNLQSDTDLVKRYRAAYTKLLSSGGMQKILIKWGLE